jgi:hypothetical protein
MQQASTEARAQAQFPGLGPHLSPTPGMALKNVGVSGVAD